MKKLLWTLTTIATFFLLFQSASAQGSGQLWKLSANQLFPINSSWGITVPSLANLTCIGTNGSGVFGAGTCSGGGGVWPFTTGNTNFGVAVQSTSTPEWFTAGLHASSTSQLVNANFYGNIGVATTAPVFPVSVVGDLAATKGLFGTASRVGAASQNTWVHPYFSGQDNDSVHTLYSISPSGTSAGTFASRTSDNTGGPTSDTIPLLALAVNDTTTSGGNPSWAAYLEGDTASTSVNNSMLVEENSSLNQWTPVTLNPNTDNLTGNVENLRLDCGKGNGDPNATTCTDALHILNNGDNYESGIIISKTALNTAAGRVADGLAMSTSTAISFYDTSSTPVWKLYATANTGAQTMVFANNGIGVSTTTPDQELTLQAAAPKISFYGTTGNRESSIGSDGFNFVISAGSGDMKITQSGNTWVDVAAAGSYTNFPNGKIGISTSTPNNAWLVSAATTLPQIGLADGSASNNTWTLRAINNNLYFATSTYTATSSVAAFALDTNGIPTFASLGGSTGCAQFSSLGTLSNTGTACGTGGGGAWPFTPSTYAGVANQSTTTPFWLKNTQLIASSSLVNFASSTAITASGTVYANNFYDTSTAGSSCIGDSSGILENGNCVASLASSGGSLTISSPTGAVDASINLSHSNTWSALQTFGAASTSQITASYASSTLGYFGMLTLPPLATPAGSFLAVDNNGKVIATTTPSSTLSGGTTGMLTSWASPTTLNSTSTPTAAAYIATSTTATSTFAGPVHITPSGLTTTPLFFVGTSTTGIPLYGSVQGDVIDGEMDFNGTAAINIANANAGTCASSGVFGDGNIVALASDYSFFGFTNAGWTGAGCAFGNGLERPESTVISQPTGDMDFELASTSNAVAYKWYTQNTTPSMVLLNQNGNLGIGSTTPTNALGVNGYIDVDGNAGGYKFSGNKFIYASSTNFSTVMGIGAGVGLDATSTVLRDTAVGYQSMNNAPSSGTNSDNTAFGYQSLKNEVSGNDNVAVGSLALALSNGTGDTAIGFDTLANLSGAANNTALGNQAMVNWVSGNGNTAFGSFALSGASGASGTFNSGFGQSSLTALSSGSNNTAFGRFTGFSVTTGSNNDFIGVSTGSTTVSGSNNTAVGYDIALPLVNGSNQLDIGNIIYGTGVNGEGPNVSKGNVSIATTTPAWGLLTLATSSEPQLQLSDNSGGNNWFMRWINSTFYMGTSTATATSSGPAAIAINPNGVVTLGLPLPAGSGGTGATSLSPAFTVASNVLSNVTEFSFSISTSTAWTGTTTIPIEQTILAKTYNGIRCKTNAGTLNVQIGTGSASTTNNFNAYSSNNTFTAGNSVSIDIGTPASSPTLLNCTVEKTV